MTEDEGSLHKAYHEAVKVALLKEWDPIGIKDFVEAEDEYDAYVPDLVRLLMARKSASDIFAYLWQLETEHMGLDGDRLATARFAKRLTEIRADTATGHLKSSKST
jgi:hypothetical protein